jgi:hypothetical protein
LTITVFKGGSRIKDVEASPEVIPDRVQSHLENVSIRRPLSQVSIGV